MKVTQTIKKEKKVRPAGSDVAGSFTEVFNPISFRQAEHTSNDHKGSQEKNNSGGVGILPKKLMMKRDDEEEITK